MPYRSDCIRITSSEPVNSTTRQSVTATYIVVRWIVIRNFFVSFSQNRPKITLPQTNVRILLFAVCRLRAPMFVVFWPLITRNATCLHFFISRGVNILNVYLWVSFVTLFSLAINRYRHSLFAALFSFRTVTPLALHLMYVSYPSVGAVQPFVVRFFFFLFFCTVWLISNLHSKCSVPVFSSFLKT
jgi:hypothetical protein